MRGGTGGAETHTFGDGREGHWAQRAPQARGRGAITGVVGGSVSSARVLWRTRLPQHRSAGRARYDPARPRREAPPHTRALLPPTKPALGNATRPRITRLGGPHPGRQRPHRGGRVGSHAQAEAAAVGCQDSARSNHLPPYKTVRTGRVWAPPPALRTLPSPDSPCCGGCSAWFGGRPPGTFVVVPRPVEAHVL